ncbi:MAG TPA: ABC transporter [Actinobacteria bacterium]|jgi:ribose transport system ATP-binding protein|nr:ABC transporter [Actinomycetota bacterium]
MTDPVSGELLLSLEGVSKSFPGVRALSDVSLEVRRGEVHALVGENGAGKSTLMAVASGALTPDTGSVVICGHTLETADPMLAQAYGLAIVRQTPALLPQLTVLENMELSRGTRWISSAKRARAWARECLDPWELNVDPSSRVEDLTVEQKQIVEMTRALAAAPLVLILDEPTEHLNLEESERLFAKVRELVSAGGSVVYISHRIHEVKAIADRITVLRDGKVRGTFQADDVDEHQIISLVIGRELDAVFPRKADESSITGGGIEVKNFRGEGFGSVDFHARSGEVVGIAGVQGEGQDEFLRALCGLRESSGSLRVNDHAVRSGSAAALASAGLAFIPADRHAEGVFMPLSVADNLALGDISATATGGVVRAGQVRTVASTAVDRFAIKTPSLTTAVSSLSGGNQQKILMGRTSAQKSVIIADEPTQGVDAGARVEIYNIIRQAADDGAAVVVKSSDNLELAGLCDRVVIFSRGRIVSELTGDDISETAITTAALVSTSVRERVASTRRRIQIPAWLRGDYAASIVLVFLIVALGAYVASQNEFYLTARNFTGLLALLAPLAVVAMAQQTAMLGGGFDLSVGPLSGFMLVVGSFYIIEGVASYWIAVGFVLVILVGLAVGAINGGIIQGLNVNAVIVTLAMFMLLRGLSLTLRDRPEGSIDERVTDIISATIGPIPVAIIVVIVGMLCLEVLLRRSRAGLALRAIGSNPEAAARIGVRVGRVRFWSYVATSALVIPAGILLMAQVGIGDPSSGITYTLASITAVVLGGARVMGGRGSYIGAFFGAFLIVQVQTVTTFLQLGQSWQYWLMGILLLGSTVLFAATRRKKA